MAQKTKECGKCGVEHPVDNFYNNKRLSDGLSTYCRDCTKAYMNKKNAEYRLNMNGLNERAAKVVKKFKIEPLQVGYPVNAANPDDVYHKLFPEKLLAADAVKDMVTPYGMKLHHWSYRKEHRKDVMVMSCDIHRKLHKYISYDQERMMYRTTDGVLLATKEDHADYVQQVKLQ